LSLTFAAAPFTSRHLFQVDTSIVSTRWFGDGVGDVWKK
jgi:hypothetical protein